MRFLREYISEEDRVKYDREAIIQYITDNNLEYEYMNIIADLADARSKKLRSHLFGDAYISKQEVMKDAIRARNEYDEDWCGYEIANDIIEIIEDAEEF